TYYFPGWATGARWEPIDRVAPQRRPVLGWYDESSPEVVDWQIKWAVEHGVSFFLVDWYWSAGNTNLMHWLEALDQARYKNQLQWAVMWANHNAPNTHSEADWRKVTQFWIDHYLKQPNYLKVNGKPAVYLWSPHNIRRDLGGSEAVKKLFAMSQEMAQAAGLPGITFVAMNEGEGEAAARQLAAETYAGNATYHWWSDAPNRASDSRNYSYELVAERSRPGWEKRRAPLAAQGLFYQPTADTGWDARPWHGDKSFVIHDRTPALFERILRDAKAHLDQHGEDTLILGPWNEWGEGSYIEPNLEYGFEMLEAVRRVFCEPGEHPADVVPLDLGLGPYDLSIEPPVMRTAWDFNEAGALQGWNGMMGLTEVGLKDGALYGRTTTQDPAFGGPSMNVRAKEYPYLVLRLKASPGADDGLQVFWSTVSAGTSEESSVRAKLLADGQYHTYVLPLAECPRWRGVIRQFRIDPGSRSGVEVWIDDIKLAKEKPAG
ncbi:MAG: glycoside hydrolase family 99-like domain-containing protein, partial [Armatimonadetes bacterium]|nr:glycoside hydrolase family 99-like domain-containing protein [Armatimonadota bacterium]